MPSAITFRSLIVGLALALSPAIPAAAVDKDSVAPDFELPLLADGIELHLQDYRGRVVLLDFWASWCGPCRESLPQYQKLREAFPRTDFEVIAINVDEEASDALQFLARHPVQFPLPHDPQGKVAGTYQPIGMPTSYLIDREGIVRSRHSGFKIKDIAPLRAQIERLIAEVKHAD